jgi:UDP-N-acetylbacillosamine N-acetyltransferase
LTKIAIIGSGGHTRSSVNILKEYFDKQNMSIYDDSFERYKYETIEMVPLAGCIDDIAPDQDIFLSIGENTLRKKYFLNYKDKIIRKNIFHRNSLQEIDVTFGYSNQFYANSYINSQVKIGDNNIINSGAIIEHESKVGSHNHIAIGVKICGRVNIGNMCLIGAGSVILDNLSICDNVTIGAGAIIVKDIDTPGIYVGNPAKRIK